MKPNLFTWSGWVWFFNFYNTNNMNFSQRMGISPSIKEMQSESIDNDLMNSLWNIINIFIFDNISDYSKYGAVESNFERFGKLMWHSFYKLPIDEMPHSKYDIIRAIRKKFYNGEWNEIYNFLEYLATVREESLNIYEYINAINIVLEKEFSSYRFLDNLIVPISNKTEIATINESINKTESFTALNVCNIHLKKALEKLSDRKAPDYRNSIKESICAVEAFAKIISGNDKDSLGGAIDKIKGKLKIHGALEKGIKSIYAYTSDSDGIRHALTEEATVDFEDAKFMLVSCSAFVNYLIVKANKAGISF
ncbi:MAG: hypothetical protein KA319_06155 [Ferruginibacter sp.]|nr:hypothetical protein [Ferruginibacter sp.]